MLHHLSLGVRDLAHAAAFYDAFLSPLGFRRVFEDETAVGYGWEEGKDKLCLKLRDKASAPGPGFHVAFSAPNRVAVERAHAAAMQVGGRDNGAPGLRPHYGAHYFAAFLIDPDGHAIEVVINTPA